jgi:subtilase family serine protease
MKLLGVKILTTVFLICMILASSYSSLVAAQEPEWQAQPMHRIKAGDLNPNALGDGAPYFNPAEIKAAYNLPTDNSVGLGTIAIIDAYDNPKVATDLALFSTQFGLSAANLEVHKMSLVIQANAGWAMEIALDVQWAHAIAPNAKILLVEAKSNSITDLIAAVDYARSRVDVVAISMSWGAGEFLGQTTYDTHFQSDYGASFYASSGDTGGVISWPSSSANVISVGGTTLTQSGSSYSEIAWSGSGGGVSAYEIKPAYQTKLTYTTRVTPDVAYNADPATGFLVYDSYGIQGQRGWFAVGGTSAGAPQWAAIQAIGKSATNTNFYDGYPQSYGIDFTDITLGQSGSYPATNGYDLSTGIGSPKGTDFGAPPAPTFAISASPSSLTINAGTQGSTIVTITSIGGFNDPVTLSTSSNWITSPPDPITPPYAPAQLTINVPSDANVGPYTITITGTVSGTVRTTTLTVQVTKPDFSLTANPTSLSIRQGNSGTTRITVNSINNYAGSPTLSASGAPTGMTITFSKNPVLAGSSATITISVARTTAQRTYTITITGTDTTGLSHTATVRVTVSR